LNFDPLAELEALKQQNSMDPAQRKSVWKMNYKLKNSLELKVQKEELINTHLLSKIKDTCITNVADIRVAETL
jgi:hypothetical protein